MVKRIARSVVRRTSNGLRATLLAAGVPAGHTAGGKPAVAWARHGVTSRLVGRCLPPRQPAALVLGLPRSGSSWVGKTLGRAGNALYLREPVTQPWVRRNPNIGVLFDVDPAAPPPLYAQLGDDAFHGIPAFNNSIAQLPEQWSLAARMRRRPVIKEVNPFACAWLLQTFHPKTIILLRHPAAIFLSFHKLKWMQDSDNVPRLLGDTFGRAHQLMLAQAAGNDQVCVVKYEQLCEDPVPQFRQLFKFAALQWTQANEDDVRASTTRVIEGQPYSTNRLSHDMIDAWKREVSDQDLESLWAAYSSYNLPVYTSETW